MRRCLFVWLNKTRTVKPLRCFHSWRLSFDRRETMDTKHKVHHHLPPHGIRPAIWANFGKIRPILGEFSIFAHLWANFQNSPGASGTIFHFSPTGGRIFFARANLHRAIFSWAIFGWANFDGRFFSGRFSEGEFQRANLNRANFFGRFWGG